MSGAIAEQVHAGAPGQLFGERDLREVRPAARAAGVVQVAERLDAEVLPHVEQSLEDLARRLGIRERPVDGRGAGPEVPGQRAQAHVRHIGPHEPPCELRGAHRRRGEGRILQTQERRVQEGHVEGRIVRDDHGSARELQEAREDLGKGRRAGDEQIADAGEVGDRSRDRPLAGR